MKRYLVYSVMAPLPVWCRRCHSWRCRGRWAGRRSHGRAPRTLQLWQTRKAERTWSHDPYLQLVWLWGRAWKSHWRSARHLEYGKSWKISLEQHEGKQWKNFHFWENDSFESGKYAINSFFFYRLTALIFIFARFFYFSLNIKIHKKKKNCQRQPSKCKWL